MPDICSVVNLSKSFGGFVVVDDVSFTLEAERITGLIGPNGAGKTSLFNLISGFIRPDRGEVRLRGRSISGLAPHRIVAAGLARTFQDLRLFGRLTALENVMLAFPGQPGEDVKALFFAWRRANRVEQERRQQALEFLEFVGLEAKANALAEDLSYGQQKRVAIARLLASGAELLMLDEPAAGLDPEAVEGMNELIQALVGQGKSILIVEHNLQVVSALCDRAIFLDRGRLVLAGPPQEVLTDPRVTESFLGV